MSWLIGKIKKYRHIIAEKLELRLQVYTQRRLSRKIDHKNIEFDYQKPEKLPYPVRWSQVREHTKLNVEIGCGHGELLDYLSLTYPSSVNVGFERTKRYSAVARKKIAERDNAKVFTGDGYHNTVHLFERDSIDRLYILFPDPWHKKRHHKRRPIVESWMRDVEKNLKRGKGSIYFVTDWSEYFEFVMEEAFKVYDIYKVETGIYHPADQGLVETHYYNKWVKVGRTFRYIRLIRKRAKA